MARMLAPSNPRSANSSMAASRIEARVAIERCCSALLRGRSRRPVVSPVFFAIWFSSITVPERTPSDHSYRQISRDIQDTEYVFVPAGVSGVRDGDGRAQGKQSNGRLLSSSLTERWK